MSTEHDGGARPRRSAGPVRRDRHAHAAPGPLLPAAGHGRGHRGGARLRRLKARDDPRNLFRDNVDIPPDLGDAAEAGRRAGRTAGEEAA
jgi:hypothetical protein